MSARLFLGIDGGGSRLRICLVDEAMNQVAALEFGTANPNVIGHDAAAVLIQRALAELLQTSDEPKIVAGGIGIAGASSEHSEPWLRATVAAVLPDMPLVTSSDIEIALVGAHGRRFGVLLLAGTGSAAYGVNAAGLGLQVGGWGYLLGDEGSGFWIGLQALRLLARAYDGHTQATSLLLRSLSEAYSLNDKRGLLKWVYAANRPNTAIIAHLAELVLDCAQKGDDHALAIINEAAGHLAELVRTLTDKLSLQGAPVAFAGGLLETPNLLTSALLPRLSIDAAAPRLYTPVVGAALLARLRFGNEILT